MDCFFLNYYAVYVAKCKWNLINKTSALVPGQVCTNDLLEGKGRDNVQGSAP